VGIGKGVVGPLTTGSLTSVLQEVLQPSVVERARGFAPRLGVDGAMVAARRLTA